MNTPVKFELAKLLKEKGFDEIADLIYMTNHATRALFENINNLKHSDGNNPFVSAPIIAEVCMWLYEKHGVWIYVDSHEFSKWCYYHRYNRPHELSSKITENGQFGLDDFNSPTEAYEAAIEYTLKNLI